MLSGMLRINEVGDSTYLEWGDPGRFFAGLALFKGGKGQKLVFTGGKIPSNQAKKTEEEVLKNYEISNGIPSVKIFVTKELENTAEEAVAVKELISTSKKSYLSHRLIICIEQRGSLRKKNLK